MSENFYRIKLEYLEKITKEIYKSNLIVIASRPAMGKSTVIFNIAKYYVVYEDTPVCIFSLEISKQSIIDNFNELSSNKVFINDIPVSVEEIKDKCIQLKKEKGIGAIFIDYLQLISTEKKIKSIEQEREYISLELKDLAEELNVPIILASKLSKDIELRENKLPGLSDFKYSSSLIKVADVIIFLYRDYNTDNEDEMEIIFAKNVNTGIYGDIIC